MTPTGTRIVLAKALLMPHFEYCSVVYSYALSAADLKLLNRAFHAVIRYAYGLRRMDSVGSYVDRFLGCSLANVYKLRAMSFLYKPWLRYPGYHSELLVFGRSDRTR